MNLDFTASSMKKISESRVSDQVLLAKQFTDQQHKPLLLSNILTTFQ